MKQPIFTGMASAIITPLTENGIDYEAFAKLLDWQINEGINAIVVCGTTGEASTLTDDEHKEAIKFAVNHINGRVPVIAGTGSNDTAYALELTKYSCEVGVDGVLVVTPYYNKATQKGLIKMFTEIADVSTKPVILYNVPSRTGVNIAPKTVAELAKHPNINAIKEASGNISQIAEVAHLCDDNINIYSGNDDQVIPILALGGKGCISVLSNLLPKESVQMCDKFFGGDVAGACKMQLDYLPLINALFSEVNPIPVKAAMAKMGYCEDFLRSPLTPMEDTTREVLFAEMKKAGINIQF
ncbi:MAG: 4-hydroxy-tetrahydrodipicolinate synthase [Clostridia bacterium]|nr:4-hydroxy-tetrahydrodipicolinate synthase [Clostridia bacterium]